MSFLLLFPRNIEMKKKILNQQFGFWSLKRILHSFSSIISLVQELDGEITSYCQRKIKTSVVSLCSLQNPKDKYKVVEQKKKVEKSDF